MHNPEIKYAKSKGIDLPIMYVYIAGRIAGNCIEKCLDWRYKIVKHYKEYKVEETYCLNCAGTGYSYTTIDINNNTTIDCSVCKGTGKIKEYTTYPISFLDALNSKESDSVDKQGLTSAIPPNLIYDKDLLSVEKTDVVVANMEDYMEADIEDILKIRKYIDIEGREYFSADKSEDAEELKPDFEKLFFQLQDAIINRRPNWGTNSEVAWALYLRKPLILIAGTEKRKRMLELHPFTKRASVIVENVDELLKRKWLQILYKSISGATYE